MQTFKLTAEDKDILEELLTAYDERVAMLDNSVSHYMAVAHEVGEIASSGDKYAENIKFFEVKDKIRDRISKRRIAARKLIYQIINSQ